MKKESINKIKLGIFVSIGIVILFAGIYLIGQSRKIFTNTFKISALFKDVNGLQVGNNVRFAGINVGSIEGIEIVTDTTVKVDMIVDADTQQFIKKDSKAIIGTEGLMGNKIMIISPGTDGTQGVENNDMIGTTIPVSLDDVLIKLKTTTDNSAIITNDLALIIGQISSGKGTIGRLFMDNEFAKKIDETLNNIQQGSDIFKLTLGEAQMITSDLALVTNSISTGKGSVGKLFMDTALAGNIDSTVINVKEGVKSFKLLMDAAQDSWLMGNFFGGKTKKEEEQELKEEQEEELKEKNEELKEEQEEELKEKNEALKEKNEALKEKQEEALKEKNEVLKEKQEKALKEKNKVLKEKNKALKEKQEKELNEKK